MLKIGQRAIVRNNEGGHFYKGKEVVITYVADMSYEKPYYVQACDGVTCSWYAERDLDAYELSECKAT